MMTRYIDHFNHGDFDSTLAITFFTVWRAENWKFMEPEFLQVIIAQPVNNGRGRQVWHRRKLAREDTDLRFKTERVPFLEEQVRIVRETGKIMTMDIHRLMLSEENRFDFVNEIAAEANEYVENDRDAYGREKKAILHVLSNRINEAGFHRPDAYAESDPYKPGPGFLKEFYT